MKKYLIVLMVLVPAFGIMPSKLIDKVNEQNYKNELVEKLQNIDEFHTDPKKWAFIIAAEQYDETDPVAFSVESGKLFVEVAKKVLHVSDRRTYALIGEDATMGKIKNRLNKLLEYVKEGDTIYFYYSGHGIPDIQTKEPYILPRDLDPSFVKDEPDFKLANIYKRLQESKAGKVVAFVDSCFSGATDNKTLFKGVAAPRIKAKSVKIDETKMVVITAGQDKQFSNMYADKKMRLFSYFLAQSLIDGTTDIKQVFKKVKNAVEEKSFELGDQYFQSPTIVGNVNMEF